MYAIHTVKRTSLLFYISLVFLILVMSVLVRYVRTLRPETSCIAEDSPWISILEDLVRSRNNHVLNGDYSRLESLYVTDERNGRWAYENEVRRSQYLSNWAAKQGAVILGISTELNIKSVKQVGRGHAFYYVASTEYAYAYTDETETVNTFRLGTYHSMDLIPKGDGYVISREWYDDPLSCVLDLDKVTDDMTAHIRTQQPKDISGISDQRVAAVAYADTYCGPALNAQNGYNSTYTDYNALGGDCANFVSQILYEGGGFRKNGTWNYKDGKGSRAWINAQGLKNYMLYSGRATLISSGKYKDVYKHAYSLMPGDIIAYAKKGEVAHVSFVTGLDSKGYPLVNCHNADRYRVPWDIGWRSEATTFYLISVHY